MCGRRTNSLLHARTVYCACAMVGYNDQNKTFQTLLCRVFFLLNMIYCISINKVSRDFCVKQTRLYAVLYRLSNTCNIGFLS